MLREMIREILKSFNWKRLNMDYISQLEEKIEKLIKRKVSFIWHQSF